MGVYLSTPKTDKLSADGENSRVRFGLSSMQGGGPPWRTRMLRSQTLMTAHPFLVFMMAMVRRKNQTATDLHLLPCRCALAAACFPGSTTAKGRETSPAIGCEKRTAIEDRYRIRRTMSNVTPFSKCLASTLSSVVVQRVCYVDAKYLEKIWVDGCQKSA
ncbi:uncharacterized protein LOC110435413 [Sorghum bicolor]|uniref:Uncharacterized protein n=1 Tax=Sorghum bicolor TaxID=4558 RepID=A0A1B6PTT2_SORBI|nr:uncharacterized protein LOC110435413 [Sorghum bicolor]KXG29051.1 hypothetical protein SORBI_3005G204800 [Sorghum bicolor]|eukprot:XP_021316598.1 uncharacterized protein LOC110435413 [Sorghum bicolor]